MKDFASVDVSQRLQELRIQPGAYGCYSKRAFDVMLALLLMPLVAPVVGILWLLVKRGGGSGFYAQERVGMNGSTFQCWKLRTMVPDAETVLGNLCARDAKVAAEWHRNQKLANDPRITRVGAFLRATSLDELPQLWNVLRGEMSFVGPRPFMLSQEALYRSAGGEAYFQMRPGITGPWQVNGRGTTSFVDRVTFDTAYCRRLSFAKDLQLIFKTAGVVFRCGGQ